MTALDHALALAAEGFHVFPCEAGGKIPLIKEYPTRATRDPEQIRKWFDGRGSNIGISTSRFGDSEALIVIDVDNKKGKCGDDTLFMLDLEGFSFPNTRAHRTPNGGQHIIYVSDQPFRQGADVLGPGLDVRSKGGYIVAPGSFLDGRPYVVGKQLPLAQAPAWLVERLGLPTERHRSELHGSGYRVDAARAAARAIDWLSSDAPIATDGDHGDSTTYKVAARVKDFGCDEAQAVALMDEFWNDRCLPPWGLPDLEAKVAHAYRYGLEPPGSAAPEVVFEPAAADEEVEGTHPFDKLNQEFAYVQRGGFVLQETTDEKGRFVTEHLDLGAFHTWFANQPMTIGDKTKPVSQWWIASQKRRQFERVVFMPEQTPGPRFYNLWRGFSVNPAESSEHPTVEAFKEHALKNVCNGDAKLCYWLLGFFAHVVQRPWEKPLVALVFKGGKGVGKNALVERVGSLLGSHFLVADDERYLLGNFNSHLEANLCFVLDEAAWAGDKRAEGKLKGLVTGTEHNIERKGHEPYKVANLTRVMILGNEDWLVPASVDERRFAVFNVGEGRKQDRKFFESMRVGMEQGGYAYLLKFFQEYDLTGVDVNEAPNTEALIEQKHHSLPDVQKWWLDCLATGSIAGGDWGGEWPMDAPTNRFREAFARWCRSRNIRSRLLEEIGFGRALLKMAPSLRRKRARPDNPADSSYTYLSPGIERLREDWEKFVGGKVNWSTLE